MENSQSAVDCPPVSLETVADGVALVTLRRARVRNAIDEATAVLLERIVENVERDETIRAAVLTGDGAVFCAGADLREVAAGRLDQCFRPGSGFAGFVNARRAKPWIAAVNGPALAGGFEIVLGCDMVVASEECVFGLPEVRRGLIASAGGLYRLPRILPRAIAMEMILTGGTLSAERALAMGVVNRVVATSDVVPEALAMAGQICANAPLAVRESVRIARAASGFDDERLRSEAETAQAGLQRTEDYGEGARAFIEKRSPRWRGR